MAPKMKKPAHISQEDWDDVDSPEWTADDFARARPAAEIVPGVVTLAKKARGRPHAEVTKMPVTIRLDPDVVAAFKKDGAGWQTRIGEVLAQWVSKKMTQSIGSIDSGIQAQVDALEGSTKQISEAVEMINKISAQTTALAIAAVLESVRVGAAEHAATDARRALDRIEKAVANAARPYVTSKR
ncbi:MAG: BrnA antitoxin family protein [Proteobacteria bacterium]|nr:BrnA antitoxin family protein [Pseudomonadota bacterium]